MIRKIVFLLIFLNFSYAYGNEQDFTKIIAYLKNNQPKDHKLLSLSFQKKELGFFGMANRLEKDLRPRYLRAVAKRIHHSIYENNCSVTSVEAVTGLVAKNIHSNVLKVVYRADAYDHYYSKPLQLNGCNLTLVYEEKRLSSHVFPGSGSGFIKLFETRESEFHLIMSLEIFEID